mgnify:FL=1
MNHTIPYGVYSSSNRELVITRQFVFELYNLDNDILGAALYIGDSTEHKLIGICERYQSEAATGYAFINSLGEASGNNFKLKQRLNRSFQTVDLSAYLRKDIICLAAPDRYMPTVSEDEMFFTMNTNKLEFVFLLRNKDENIYCGASVTVSCDKGLFGGRQYFRIRNYQDNSEPYCGFYSFLGEDVIIPDVDSSNFHTGSC